MGGFKTMKKLLISVPCYGEPYTDIFLNLHLGSLLDESNIPAVKDRVSYLLVTDQETEPRISSHPNFKKLVSMVGTGIGIAGEKIKHEAKYDMLITAFKMSVDYAIKNEMVVSSVACDMVFGKEFIPKVLGYMEHFDSVFFVPMRSTYEPMRLLLPSEGAISALNLFKLAHENLHPLWTHAMWKNPFFTKQPYSILWGNEVGLLARSFSVSPLVFTPRPEHLSTNHVLDIEIPNMVKNPIWISDFIDCPIVGVEPIHCCYPTFHPKEASVEGIKSWMPVLLPSQLPYLQRKFWYPSQETVAKHSAILEESDTVVRAILGA